MASDNHCWGVMSNDNNSSEQEQVNMEHIADPEEFNNDNLQSILNAVHMKFLFNIDETCYIICEDKKYLLHARNIDTFIEAMQKPELVCEQLRELTFDCSDCQLQQESSSDCCQSQPEPSSDRYISNDVDLTDRINDAILLVLNCSTILILNYVTPSDFEITPEK